MRFLAKLDPSTDFTLVTLLLDLKRALGDDPGTFAILTPRQRQVIQVHLLENREAAEAARILSITERVLFLEESDALERLLKYLNGGESDSQAWAPWMIQLTFNANVTVDEIMTATGKSRAAVWSKLSELRLSGHPVPYRNERRSGFGKQSNGCGKATTNSSIGRD